ncbi:MAG: hypothetical protein V7785_07705 [Bermanella sp.]
MTFFAIGINWTLLAETRRSLPLELIGFSLAETRRSLPSMAPRHTVHPVHKKATRGWQAVYNLGFH